ncbi:MAG TPA: C1 family peptidase [Bacteroidales bacterium]|nr:C1 family peptidase [Bacteroidales bacterium]HPS63317.1 C1 family peptidase [Bacteroidales bacterium]
MKIPFLLLLAGLTTASAGSSFGQDTEKKSDSGYRFTIVKQLPATSVKNQYRSGTCWSYSAISFLESELLRNGKDTFDLSEMYCVRNCYSEKAVKYIRFNGKHNFGGGGAAHDVTWVLKNFGMVPDEVYNGMTIGEQNPVHGEMDAVLSACVDAVLKNPNKKLTPVWHQGFDGLLDAYLGKVPEKFTYKGKEYTPKTFSDMMGLNPDDYVEISSYTHHPFYSKFIIEIPDNWLMDEVYNLPLDELMQVIDNSVNQGYTVVWGADVSEKGFAWKNGVAVVPDKNAPEVAGMESAKWTKMSDADKEKFLTKFDKPYPEKKITQEMRQTEFDNYQTTDDHGMHLTGIAKDQNGTKYYLIKNSWGTDGSPYKGYFYASEAYVKLKTMDIMVHKNAIPKDIRKKLGIN